MLNRITDFTLLNSSTLNKSNNAHNVQMKFSWVNLIKPPLNKDVFVKSDYLEPLVDPTIGLRIADKAMEVAKRRDNVGQCYSAVAETLQSFGVILWGESAFMAANQLARNDLFEEIKVDRKDLKSLEAGCIVVWDKCDGHPDGHISIAIGNGKEASDHIQNQIVNYGPRYRIFKPLDYI